MKNAKRLWAVVLGLLGFSAIAQAHSTPQASTDRDFRQVDEATLKELLTQPDPGVAVRSRHAAVDRLLLSGDAAADPGHDKTTFDKEYDKLYNRETYTKTYEKGS